MDPKYNLTFHHIGCLTNDIEASKQIYVHALGFKESQEIFTITGQRVKVCFIEIGPGIFLELVQPQGENHSLSKILNSKNPFYHLGYKTDNFEQTLVKLQEDGFYLVNTFISEAFGGKRCSFLYTGQMHLIEIIEN